MTKHTRWWMVALCSALVACGSDDDGGGGTSTLKAPVVTDVAPMAGGLHVMWQNAQADCDAIEGERKTATEEYAVVFSEPGSADNKHDGSLTAGTEYTYRLRCKKDDHYSAYSNEMSGTP